MQSLIISTLPGLMFLAAAIIVGYSFYVINPFKKEVIPDRKKIQSVAEYQKLARRTCAKLNTRKDDLVHMNLGIITEVGEALDVIKKFLAYKKPMDLVNLGEEIADLCWYLSNRGDMFFVVDFETIEASCSFKESEEEFKKTGLQISSLEQAIYALITLIPESEDFRTTKEFVEYPNLVILKSVAEYFELDFYQLLTNNIAKLEARYPEKFTEESALNRDLGRERIILERK